MASFNYYLKDSKADTPTAIYLLFDDGVNRAKLYVQLSILPKHWLAKDAKAGRSYQGYSEFNLKLRQMRDHCETLYVQLTRENRFSVEALKEQFKAYIMGMNGKLPTEASKYKGSKHLVNFYSGYIERMAGAWAKNTIKNHRVALRNLERFEKYRGKPISFEEVDLDFYYTYKEYNQDVEGFKPNTIGMLIKKLKAVMNGALENKLHSNVAFKGSKFQSVSEDVQSIFLDEGEIGRIADYDFGADKRLDNARDLFLIGCYTGLRYSDFSQLKRSHQILIDGIPCISVKTTKTGEKVDLPLHPVILKILEKYQDTAKGFPRNIASQNLNNYLKEIGKRVGIDSLVQMIETKGKRTIEQAMPKYELISTHTARRSFATNLYKSGYPAINLMKLTGHRTERNLLKYIKISTEENAVKLHEHWQSLSK